MLTQKIPEDYQHTSPAGAEVRLLMNNHLGGMAHCTLKKKEKFPKLFVIKQLVNFGMLLQGKVLFGVGLINKRPLRNLKKVLALIFHWTRLFNIEVMRMI